MTCCYWIILFWGILFLIIFVIAITAYRRYWIYNFSRLDICWDEGWVFPCCKFVFFIISLLSLGAIAPYRAIGWRLNRKSCEFFFVDSYIFIWALFIGVLSWLATTDSPCLLHNCVLLGFLSYRIFEIFQSWVSQFITYEKEWTPINVYRTLVLVFVGYIEITFSFALIAFILKDNFQGINCWIQALHYSLGNAVTIGSSITTPTTGIGYTLFATQLMFTLLFLVSAVNRIYASITQRH